jgi:hypothetical protein
VKTPSFSLTRIWQQLTFGDFLLLSYELVFLRQYFWSLDSQQLAWIATVIAGLLIWIAFLFFKKQPGIRTPRQFWLIVGIPLLIVYAMRAALPDSSFDVLNYRLVNAERSMRGWPFLRADFLPAFYPLNPAPDMIMAIGRWLAGYRLGTLMNLGVLLWTGTIVNRLFQPHIKRTMLRCVCILCVLWTEHDLFLINNYLVDLLAIPLLLRATEMVISDREDRADMPSAVSFGLLTGASVALKLFNLAYVIPIAVIYLANLTTANGLSRPGMTAKKLLVTGASFLIPLLPFTVFIYRQTGNPVFPFYNKLFHSPFWPPSNVFDGRWGPKGIFETIAWPITIPFRHERIGELAVYSGRITIVTVAALLAIILFRDSQKLRQLSLITVAGAIFWAAILTGYPRYGIFVEVAGGVLLIIMLAELIERFRKPVRPRAFGAVAIIFLATLAFQLIAATIYINHYEWSMRPTVFVDPRRYANEARFLLRDRSFRAFLKDDSRSLTDANLWVEGGLLTSGFQALANPRAPILCAYVPDYFYSSAGREKFAQALEAAQNNDISSLCLETEVDNCRRALADRDLEIISTIPVKIPVYSERTFVKMVLMRLQRNEKRDLTNKN